MDAETRDLLRDSIRALFDSRPNAVVAGLEELGWQEVVAEDPADAIDLFFTVQGEAGRTSEVLDQVVIDAAGAELSRSLRTQDRLAVVHPIAGASSACRDGVLTVDGVLLSDPRGTAGVAVPVSSGDAPMYVLSAQTAEAATSTVCGFDPDSGLRRVALRLPIDDARTLDCDGPAATAAARRALAAELVGNGFAMLDIAVDHVGQRMQFGRPIGSNQSPRHSLAHSYALLSGARELVRVAWETLTEWDARVAKTYAGYALSATSAACLQVCGAMGLTAEHRLGGYVKRARILDGLYGGWRQSVHEIGASLLRAQTIPIGPPL
ncbi:acyl-CoA dehydrogenase family protein [Mycolicibacterium thermoresistibile]